MDRRRLTAVAVAALPAFALAALVVAALVLATDAGTAESRLGRWPTWIFAAALVAALVLVAGIVRQVLRLRRAVRERVPGARLASRWTFALSLFVLPPLLLVWGFALGFLGRTIDSWFDVRIEQALDDALELGRVYVDERLDAARAATTSLATTLADAPDAQAAVDAAADAGALQVAIFEANGTLGPSAAADARFLLPAPPDDDVVLRARAGALVAAAEPLDDDLVLRVVAALPDGRVLQTVHALPSRTQPLVRALEGSYHDYQRLEFLRDALKVTFALILSLVLLLALLLAVLAALALARRQAAPIARLAAATADVAAGQLDRELPPAGDDELGELTGAFNRMTRELAAARAAAEKSRADVEHQRSWLASVLEGLTSVVVTLDSEGRLSTINAAGVAMLGDDAAALAGVALDGWAGVAPALAPFADALARHRREARREWREEVRLARGDATQLLMVRGASLPGGAGDVAVFDDLAVLTRAQRDAAWAEVARRLAHEVKNPLTPIQLATERLQLKLAPRLDAEDAQLLDKAARTIVGQVEALKTLVNEFGDYARVAAPKRETVDLSALVGEVADLYDQSGQVRATRALASDLPPVAADAGRLRQALHNLLKNAIEAAKDGAAPHVDIATRRVGDAIEVRVADDGPGLPADFAQRAFEPYNTTKARGTGLGLAIVKKIVEEHGGTVAAANRPQGGAEFTLTLPVG